MTVKVLTGSERLGAAALIIGAVCSGAEGEQPLMMTANLDQQKKKERTLVSYGAGRFDFLCSSCRFCTLTLTLQPGADTSNPAFQLAPERLLCSVWLFQKGSVMRNVIAGFRFIATGLEGINEMRSDKEGRTTTQPRTWNRGPSERLSLVPATHSMLMGCSAQANRKFSKAGGTLCQWLRDPSEPKQVCVCGGGGGGGSVQ